MVILDTCFELVQPIRALGSFSVLVGSNEGWMEKFFFSSLSRVFEISKERRETVETVHVVKQLSSRREKRNNCSWREKRLCIKKMSWEIVSGLQIDIVMCRFP